MMQLYGVNGLMFWDEMDIALRDSFINYFAGMLEKYLRHENNAWRMFRIEAPMLMPQDLLNPAYSAVDVFCTARDLVLRPETTQGSYKYAQMILETHSKIHVPFVVWQAGKSFRLEQDQVMRNMRLKEFYQQEFQCIYGNNTQNPYDDVDLRVREFISNAVGMWCRVAPSDRLPDYSESTIDVIADLGEQQMELCSISRRKDFDGYKVLEVAIGLDRCIYAWKYGRSHLPPPGEMNE